MAWPAFSLSEAVNTAINGLVTLAGVVAGGWVAFRFALRQVRHERLYDRRLQWFEQLLPGFDLALSSARQLIPLMDPSKQATAETEARRATLKGSLGNGHSILDKALAGADLFLEDPADTALAARGLMAVLSGQILLADLAPGADEKSYRLKDAAEAVEKLAGIRKTYLESYRQQLHGRTRNRRAKWFRGQ
jgi:hypothetical protein